jgi:CBS domain-containing protein
MKLDDTIDSVLRLKGREVWSVAPTAMVFEAIGKMSVKGVGALLVMSEGRLDGIISERDYARKVILKGRNSNETRVREIMSTPALYITPDQTIDEAMRVMTQRRVRHLPILEGDTVTGVLSIGDVVNWIVTSQQQTIRHLQSYIAGQYPG